MEQKERIGFGRMIQTAVMKPREYKEILNVRKRTVVFYIMMVSLLLMFLGTVIPVLGFAASIGGPKHFITEILPKFQYKDGTFSIEQRVEVEDDGFRLVADDKVEEFKVEDFRDDATAEILISKNNLQVKNMMMGQVLELKFSDVGKGTFRNEDLAAMMPIFYLGIAVGLLFTWVYMAIGYLLGSFVFAFCGKSLGQIIGKKLPYKQMFIYAVMAKTTAGILDSMGKAADFAFFNTTAWVMIDFALILGYLYLAIKEPVKDNGVVF